MITELANKAYFSDNAVANISHSFTHKMAAKDSWHRNYVTVILCTNKVGPALILS